MSRVIIYERDACLDFVHGDYAPIVEFAVPGEALTFNFHGGELHVWEGTKHLDRKPTPAPDEVDEYYRKLHERHEARQVARHQREGPDLTAQQANVLRDLVRLQKQLAQATQTAWELFGPEFRGQRPAQTTFD